MPATIRNPVISRGSMRGSLAGCKHNSSAYHWATTPCRLWSALHCIPVGLRSNRKLGLIGKSLNFRVAENNRKATFRRAEHPSTPCPELEFSSRKQRMRRDPTPDCESGGVQNGPVPLALPPSFCLANKGLQQRYFRKNSSQPREANAKLCTDGPI